MSDTLRGKPALITGAGTGIGREGAQVVLHYANSHAGAASAVAAITQGGGKALAIQADLGVTDACFRLADSATAFLGGLDILVNNAGITETWDFESVTPAQFDKLSHNPTRCWCTHFSPVLLIGEVRVAAAAPDGFAGWRPSTSRARQQEG